MSGVYGDMLAYFPELFEKATVFSMDPKVVAGYADRPEGTVVYGVFQFRTKNNLNSENMTLVQTHTAEFWTESIIEEGMFLKRELDGLLYRITRDNNWDFSGRYHKYLVDTVAANTDEQTKDEDVDLVGGYL